MNVKHITDPKKVILSQVLEKSKKQSLLKNFTSRFKNFLTPKESFDLEHFEKIEGKRTRHKEVHPQRWI